MRHEPSRFVFDAKHAVQLMARHALLGRSKEMHRQPPFGQRNFGTLKHGSDGRRELAIASRAIEQAGANGFALGRRDLVLIDVSAMRADDAIGPNDSFKSLAG